MWWGKFLEKLEELWLGYHVKRFRASYICHNLLLLLSLKQNDSFASDSRGWLYKIHSGFPQIRFFLFNILRFGGLKKRRIKVIENTFISFCYEIRTPIDLKKMSLIHAKKLNLLNKVLKILEMHLKKSQLVKLKYELESFNRRYYIQVAVIKNAKSAMHRQRKSRVIENVKKALKEGVSPILTIRGFSGTYFMRSTSYERVGVFKPFDEEIGAPNNPSRVKFRGVLGNRFCREGIRVGEAMHREVAASIVDEFLDLQVVPKTCYAEFFNKTFVGARKFLLKQSKSGMQKIGSFQTYIPDCMSLGKLDKSAVITISAHLFYPIIILDILIGHLDRHIHNLLFNGKQLIAIDNGLSFSDCCESLDMLEWKKLPQASVPFSLGYCHKIEKIEWLPLKKKLMQKSCLSIESIRRVYPRLALLKSGTKAGLTPAKIAELMSKENMLALVDYEQTMEQHGTMIVNQLRRK